MRADRGDRPPELEAQWIRDIARGDRGAFETFYQTYQKRLFHYLYVMVRAVEVAEELTNDVMLEAWKGAGRFRGQSKLSTWLFGIAHHKALNELRRRRPQFESVQALHKIPDPALGPEAALIRDSVRAGVWRALSGLSPDHREVVELTFYHQATYQEIAAIVSCPANTVKTRMFYAKQHLRKLLVEEGSPMNGHERSS